MALSEDQVKEIERASLLFHYALVQMGADTIEGSLDLWDDIPVAAEGAGVRATQRWLSAAVSFVMSRRLRSRDLALGYYRYQRAIATGATVAIPGHEEPPYYTLPELRREFEALLGPEVMPVDSEGTPWPRPVPSWAHATQAQRDDSSPPGGDDDDIVDESIRDWESRAEALEDEFARIRVEVLENFERELEEMEKEAEKEIEENLLNLGPRNYVKKLRKIDTEGTAEEVDQAREEAHKQAGLRQAATSERVAMNGARGTLHRIGERDKRVIGYVRVSRTGTPCGWCAMLISRGPVYKSAQGTSAEVTYGDLDLYHDNCKCYAVPIYDMSVYRSEELFEMNRRYSELWPKVTKGLRGKQAISAWRRFIREEAKSRKAQEAAA